MFYVCVLWCIIETNHETNTKSLSTMQSEAHNKEDTTTTTPFCPSEYAEEIFALLQEDGLKGEKSHNATVTRTTSMDKLSNDTNKPIGVHVDVKLAREKDRMLSHRVQLAEEVRSIVQEELQTKFDGNTNEQDNSLMLCVRVVLVSDGSSSGRRFTSGVGTAKLTLAYCLQTGGTGGEVAMANQLYAIEDCTHADLESYWEYSSALVRSMARKLAEDIAVEVTTGINEYKSHKQENEELMAKIKVKLANEENLDSDEYALAAEKHLL